MNTLDHTALLQFRLGHPANAVCPEIRVPRLDASQAAKVLVSGLLPFGYQIRIGNLLPDAIIVQLPADGFSPIEQVVNISGLLVVDLEDGPQALVDTLALVTFSLG